MLPATVMSTEFSCTWVMRSRLMTALRPLMDRHADKACPTIPYAMPSLCFRTCLARARVKGRTARPNTARTWAGVGRKLSATAASAAEDTDLGNWDTTRSMAAKMSTPTLTTSSIFDTMAPLGKQRPKTKSVYGRRGAQEVWKPCEVWGPWTSHGCA